MEYVYAAMLLHKAGHKVEDATLSKVLQAAGISPEPARVKALVSALEGVDIDAAVKEASIAQVAPASAAPQAPVAKKEEKKAEEEKKSTEQAAAGLGALFG
ncbi:50S ribosomal protein P1 [Candidatus Woesearchaeota archaeon]|nr:50S ribosomal protein P1 [Candidatus Woesearchaeota archaeon]